MSEDIHKWTDGRYTLMFDEHTFFVWDNEKEERMTALNVTKKLNEQQATISKLEEENEQLKSYIDSMFLGNTHICKELDIENAMFYCEKESKHIYPNCLYRKCFDEENLVEVKEEIRKCIDE